jgi:fucose permease
MAYLSHVDRRDRVFVLPLVGMFLLFGASATVLGATIPRIIRQFGWSYTVTGVVGSAGAVGYFVSSFACGLLIHRLGARRVLLGGLALQVAGMALFGSTPSATANGLLGLLIGVGNGSIEVVGNYCIVRIERGGSSRLMNLIHAAFSVGAIVGPLGVAQLLEQAVAWQTVYRVMAASSVALGVGLMFVPFGRLGDGRDRSAGGLRARDVLRHPVLLLSFAVLLLYVGTEVGVSKWVAELFVRTLHTSVPTGARMVAVFWVGILAGRAGISIAHRGRSGGGLLLGLSVLCTSALAAVLLLGGPWQAAVALLVSGLGYSAIYPLVMTLLGEQFREAEGVAVGFAATGGGIGAFAVPFLMGAIADRFGMRWSFGLCIGLNVVMIALIAVAVRRLRSRPS